MYFIFKNPLKIISSVVLLVSLSGCASNTVLSPAEKSGIHTISINSNVTMPQDITYRDRAQARAFMIGGLIGYDIEKNKESSKRAQIKSDMQQNGVAVDSILKQAFVEKISSKTHFKMVESGFGDAQFKLNVISYGFGRKGFSLGAAPTMSVDATLVDSKGNVLWQNTQKTVLNVSPYNAYSMDYYLKHPLVMKQAIQIISSDISDKLIANLQSGS